MQGVELGQRAVNDSSVAIPVSEDPSIFIRQ